MTLWYGGALGLLGSVVCASMVGCTRSPATPRDPAPQAQAQPLTSLEGDYFATQEVYEYDPMMDEDVFAGEYQDVLSIVEAPDSALKVKIELVGHNFGQCYFDHIMTSSGPNQWSWKGGDEGRKCEVLLAETATAIVITSNWDCYHEFCGYRVTLDGTFPLSSREPVGTIEWPER